MALEESAAALIVDKGLGTVNGIKGIGLATNTTLQVPVTISGGLLIVGGVILVGVPVAFLGYSYIRKHQALKKGLPEPKPGFSPNTHLFMSLAVASSLCISVGTAMLTRTPNVMIVHVVAGYICMVLSFIHVYQYRKVIKSQAKKFWKFLNAPKGDAPLPA